MRFKGNFNTMKGKIFFMTATAMAVVAMVTSCENKETLARDVNGTWQSVPEHIVNTDSISVDLIKSFEFSDAQGAEGSLIISALIAIEEYMPESDSIVAPLTVNGAAIASIEGDFEAISYDKIILKPDVSTFSLHIDSAAVSYNYNVLTENATPELTGLKPLKATYFREYLEPVVKKNFMRCDTLTDIKLTKTLMNCRAEQEDLTLRLVTPQ